MTVEADALIVDRLGEIAALLTIIVKRDAGTQAETILELSKAGIAPTRVAALLGTTTSTVTGSLSKAKTKARPVRPKGAEG